MFLRLTYLRILGAAYNLENTLHICYILFLQGVSREAIHICFALTVALINTCDHTIQISHCSKFFVTCTLTSKPQLVTARRPLNLSNLYIQSISLS